jgi:hypothetical protein
VPTWAIDIGSIRKYGDMKIEQTDAPAVSAQMVGAFSICQIPPWKICSEQCALLVEALKNLVSTKDSTSLSFFVNSTLDRRRTVVFVLPRTRGALRPKADSARSDIPSHSRPLRRDILVCYVILQTQIRSSFFSQKMLPCYCLVPTSLI